ncbi:Protein CBG09954 [Caenorhabditis briggsae]|uniref:Protein CBG09954 n=1 Tax=Caenorhabditis briggsae TaxID=6238 RepID=A8XA14_CAEBR|nr:Protein CBG09954 [Caenorhabditis briggsae]CAP29479.2 Protein CBG09954 [Caenorhabditis briggsae]
MGTFWVQYFNCILHLTYVSKDCFVLTSEFIINDTVISIDPIVTHFLKNSDSFFFAKFIPNFIQTFRSSSNMPTIFFVTLGTFVLSLPLFFLQFYLVFFLWSLVEPRYTIAVCTFVKCITSSTTSCAQVLPLVRNGISVGEKNKKGLQPVAIYRYFIVVRNRKMPSWFVVVVHSFISIVFFVIAILNFPLGEFETNDQCAILRFSKVMEAVRISLTLGLNLFAVLINIAIYTFVKKYDKRNVDVHRRRVQLTYSMLLQSMIPILVSIPLLVGSFDFYFGYTLPSGFTSRWYATTFLSPFLTPISSMLSLRTIRHELLSVLLSSSIFNGTRKISNLVTKTSKTNAVPQSSDYSAA